MAYFKVTLIRSAIGLPRKTQGTLAALGLRKRMATVYHKINPDTAGKILKVKELVAVSEVEKSLTRQQQKATRTPETGYYVEKKAGEEEPAI